MRLEYLDTWKFDFYIYQLNIDPSRKTVRFFKVSMSPCQFFTAVLRQDGPALFGWYDAFANLSNWVFEEDVRRTWETGGFFNRTVLKHPVWQSDFFLGTK